MRPFELAQHRPVLDDVLVRRQAHIEVIGAQMVCEALALGRRAFVGDEADRWRPAGKLDLPVGHGRERDNDDEWARQPLDLHEVADERDRLDRLAKSLRAMPSGTVRDKPGRGRTISSARMPLSRLLYKLIIHCRPLSWYSLRVPPLRIEGWTETVSLMA